MYFVELIANDVCAWSGILDNGQLVNCDASFLIDPDKNIELLDTLGRLAWNSEDLHGDYEIHSLYISWRLTEREWFWGPDDKKLWATPENLALLDNWLGVDERIFTYLGNSTEENEIVINRSGRAVIRRRS